MKKWEDLGNALSTFLLASVVTMCLQNQASPLSNLLLVQQGNAENAWRLFRNLKSDCAKACHTHRASASWLLPSMVTGRLPWSRSRAAELRGCYRLGLSWPSMNTKDQFLLAQ